MDVALDQDKNKPPSRGIVEVNVYNSGAADKGMYYPDSQYGCKVSDRWATVVFTRAEEAIEVVNLYGGGNEAAVKFPDLLKGGCVHLWPLYQIDKEDGFDSSPKYQDPASLKESSAWGGEPKEAPELVSSVFIGADEKRYKWIPFQDEDYQESGAGRVHFLRITAVDPNEQNCDFNVHEILDSVHEKKVVAHMPTFDEEEQEQ